MKEEKKFLTKGERQVKRVWILVVHLVLKNF
jgi:hypothetical protein